jgi:hypothetical protein
MRTKAFLIIAALLAPGCAASAAAPELGGGWVFLGERGVSDHVEKDSIPVTAAEGNFRAVKILVRGRAVQFRRLTIHFGNGTKQEIEGNKVIPAGGESRVIDVVGADRVIKSVEFLYDAQTRRVARSGGATVLLYGLR